MIRSLQGRLILAITVAATVLALATGVLLYDSIRSDLTRQFDRALEMQASTVSSFLNVKPDGTLDFDYNEATMPQYRPGPHAQYFLLRFADGRPYAASGSLKGIDPGPVRDLGDGASNVRLPSGRTGRGFRLDFVPQFDPDANPGAKPPSAPAEPMTIVVARDRAALDASLNHFLRRLLLGAALLAGTTAVAVVLIVRHSLQSLRDVTEHVTQIDASHLHARLPTQGMPAELAPICSCLNDMLDRLDQTFARERRFTANVAHELRTPIAELRSIAEMAMRYPTDPTCVGGGAWRDAHEIARQMHTLVGTLLAMVRSEHMPPATPQPVRLADAIASVLRDLNGDECVRTEVPPVALDVPSDAIVAAEPTLLTSVLRNLISNAREYADHASVIQCSAARDIVSGRWRLAISNAASNLSADDVPHLFNPFWRKDPARTDSMHAGLGLSLVAAYCRLMRVDIIATRVEPATIEMQLIFAPSSFPERPEPADARPSAPLAAAAVAV